MFERGEHSSGSLQTKNDCACGEHERWVTYRNVPHWRDYTVLMVAGAAVAARCLVDSVPSLTGIIGTM